MSKKPLSKQIGVWDNASNQADKQQIKNAFGEIKRCLLSNAEINNYNSRGELKIYEHGSFVCNSSIKQASDLDMHVALARANFPAWKDTVERVLVGTFGRKSVKRKKVAITVIGHENRADTDVLPCGFYDNQNGVVAYSDAQNRKVKYFPKEDKSGIREMDVDTDNDYSKMVRVYKGCKQEMIQDGIDGIASFMIECLLYNLPNSLFVYDNYEGTTEDIYLKMFIDSKNALFSAQLNTWEKAQAYYEINGEKPLYQNENHFNRTREFFENMNAYIRKNYLMS
jgi:hypothetical protein